MSQTKSGTRRWLQFSLRSLLLCVLLVAVFLGGRASVNHLVEAERARANHAQVRLESERVRRKIAEAHYDLAEAKLELWQWDMAQDHLGRRSLDWFRYQQKLERIRDAKEQEEFRQRLGATGIELRRVE